MKYLVCRESRLRSLTRSIIWRLIGVVVLATITYLVTRKWITTTAITVLHHGVFVFVYYLHERFWLWCKWLRGSRWKPIVRVMTYELILGNLILGIITITLTGSLQQMSLITFIYIGNKLWIYRVYDYIWSRIKWQTE